MDDAVRKTVLEYKDGFLLKNGWKMESFEHITVEELAICMESGNFAAILLRSYQTRDLNPRGVAFLKEHFGITEDINSLSDEDFYDLQFKVFDIECDENSKASETDSPRSELGNEASAIVTYMGAQWGEGGRRWCP